MNFRTLTIGALSIVWLCLTALPASAQMGRRLPSERKIVPDPVTGVPLTFLTTDAASDSKIYQTHPQWTSDGKWVIFRSSRPGSEGQAMLINEETGDMIQATEGGYSGMLCAAHKSNKLIIMRGGRGAPQQIVEINLDKLIAESMSGNVKPAAEYERICGTLPEALRSGGNMGIDANDDFAYFNVTGPETTQLSPGQTLQGPFGGRQPQPMGAGPAGLRSMNLKTGEIKFICNVGFQIGHVQTNPMTPGEIIFCWETGGKAPQRTWYVKSDGSELRPLWPEAPYDWVTHEAAFNADEVAIAILAHRRPGVNDAWGNSSTAEYPTGLAIVNLRTKQMRIAGQVPIGDPGRSDWHVAASPDGRWAAFDDFQYRLWIIDRKNGETKLLADVGHKTSAADHIHPTFSADSKRIEIQTAMLAEDNRALDICVVPVPKSWLDRTYGAAFDK